MCNSDAKVNELLARLKHALDNSISKNLILDVLLAIIIFTYSVLLFETCQLFLFVHHGNFTY